MSDDLFAAVALDQKLILDYAVPKGWSVEIGMRVEVPLKSAFKKGTIVALKNQSSFPNAKPIARLLTLNGVLSDSLWALARWMSTYYCAPLEKTLKCFIPPNLRKLVKPKKEFIYTLNLTKEEARTKIVELRSKREAAILEQLLAGETKCRGESALSSLIEKKWVLKQEKAALEISEEEFFPTIPKKLGKEQAECLAKIAVSLASNRYATHLIQGVTGSGKTEIYLQAISEALQTGRSAIMLVPEIALTSQTIERFRARFQEKIAIWHHRRSLGERTVAWEDLQSGKTQIVIGARSAIFCPAKNLGLIIVDEEHDSSYKQSEEVPCYNARDIAVMRGLLENAVVLLGSATPSIESRYNADRGKYILSRLSSRPASASLPDLQIVDMKRAMDINGGFTHFSSALIEAMKARQEAGEQTLLFLNRRGYHRLQVCSSCRTAIQCPHCDLGLTFHKSENILRCHLCDYQQPSPLTCPSCGGRESLQFKGFGTEHVERSLHALLPGIRTLRMDRDTTKQKASHEDLYRQFRSHKADVLIGTQMIAKGFHFPSVTLVGVLNADSSLNIPDFRSAETVFQLITQVAGRAGRAELPGQVILQTFLPDHPVFLFAKNQDFEAFYARELQERRQFGFPPFCHLIKITCSGSDPLKTEAAASALHATLQQSIPPDVHLLPVLPAGHAKVKDQFRFQFIIKTLRIREIQPILSRLTSPIPFKIDIDTQNTFF
ncbi:MAG TPA: primosomal protein N' [Chlamydiales bacterium]|jgi:primosomal protein N' (replication factor Y)|nr:primosomal protein N' [Chlamydiales bacterium]